ncbi:MAG: DUF6798 domain-containing protein [Thermoguttaceae bacterium]
MTKIPRRWQIPAEIALVFAVFFVEGAWPVPEVNEPNYLGKAIHFWDPAWAQNDFFLGTADTHWVFYFTFGWLSRWLTSTALAWTGRVLTWGLLAWAWRRLSFAVAPRAWLAPVTAAWMVAMLQHGNLAGEWLIGGVEAKGFAFVLVLLGLEALALGRWNRTWLLLGAASAFHVLVGGWAAVAAGMTWLLLRLERRGAGESCAPPLRSMWPALLGGLVLALPGLVPPLLLNWGTDAGTVHKANEIYVYERLPHHLNPWKFPPEQLAPFAVLCVLWLVVGRVAPRDPPVRRLRGFVVAGLAIALAGMALSLLDFWDRPTAAGLLRFYWFRLADVALPIGLALLAARWIIALGATAGLPSSASSTVGQANRGTRPFASAGPLRRVLLAAAVLLAGLHVTDCIVLRLFSLPPHAERFWDLDAWAAAGRWLAHPGRTPLPLRQPRADRLPDYAAWREVCDWVAQPGHVPREAVFLTPRMSQTFKWYAQRSEAGTWKELPQDAQGIVQWYGRMNDFYGTGSPLPSERWYDSLAEMGPEQLRGLAAKEHIDYVLTTVSDPLLPLPIMHKNSSYVIYQISKGKGGRTAKPQASSHTFPSPRPPTPQSLAPSPQPLP